PAQLQERLRREHERWQFVDRQVKDLAEKKVSGTFFRLKKVPDTFLTPFFSTRPASRQTGQQVRVRRRSQAGSPVGRSFDHGAGVRPARSGTKPGTWRLA